MLKAGHHGAESSNSIPFMQKLHPGAIIQTGMSDDSPDRLSFLVPPRRHQVVPNGRHLGLH